MHVFATLGSVAFFGIACLVLLYCLCFWFSTGIIPARLRQKTDSEIAVYWLAGATVFAPLLSALIFLIGGNIRSGILWGCYVEFFFLLSEMLCMLAIALLAVMLIICLIIPKKFGFKKRINIIIVFVIETAYSFCLLFLMGKTIYLLAGSLNGIDSSCL
jgi:hypothetical protein